MKKNIIVLGAGMVGKAIAIDLCNDYKVTSVDLSAKNLDDLKKHYPIHTIAADITVTQKLKPIIEHSDLVIGAVPGFMGYETLKTVIQCGKNAVDISFFNEDPFSLDELARKKKVTIAVDCGVAPGMDNIILGYYDAHMKVEKFLCYVGGLPRTRTLPFEYKAPFSPIDVLEEYTRTARYVVDGKIVVIPALSEPEFLEFAEIGTLEAFNTDGLRTLIHTMKHIPNMKEKTLRYPGHIQLMGALREMGYLSKEDMVIKGKKIRPIDVTTQLLFPKWKYEPHEEEFTVMRVIVEGVNKDKRKRFVYDLLDRYEHSTKTASMSRTTGYTCTAIARLILEGNYKNYGINPPEYFGRDEQSFGEIIKYLKSRQVFYKLTEETI
jgi:lysine 6-dehydrogenase